MPNLSISQLPLITSGSPSSLMVIVSYDVVPSGVTYSIPFSSVTQQIAGNYSTSAITTNQTLTWSNNYYGISGATSVTLTLPSTSGKDGYFIIIKDESGNCSTNTITINASGGSLIDGETSVVMNINYISLTLMVRNGNWYII